MALFKKKTEEEKRRAAAERKRKFEERKARQAKLQKEVREGRAAGLSMHEIRAKRLGITPEELTKRGVDTAKNVIGGAALFAIPGGGFIRAAMSGGKIAPGVLSKIRALGGKRVAKPTAKQVKEAKPVSAVKVPKGKTSGPSTRGGRRGRKDLKSDRKVKPGASVTTGKPSALPKAKPDPKPAPAPAAKPKPTQTTTTKPTGKPTAGAGRANLKPTSPATRGSRKPVRATRKPVRAERKPVGATTKVVKPKPKPAAKPKAATRGRKIADTLLVGAGLAGAGAGLKKAFDTKDAKAGKSVTKPTPIPKAARPKSGPSTRGSVAPKKTTPRAGGPSTRGSAKPKSVRELEAMKKPRASGPSTRGGAKRGATKIITAGKNTGFGPKGNIFPKNAADRERLMKLYGGTGSAAAKAAAAGKQGTLAKKGTK